MKTKHYILVAVALLIIVAIGLPYYYWITNTRISYDATHGGTIQFCQAPQIGDTYNDNFMNFAIMWWKIKIFKPAYYSFYKKQPEGLLY